MIGRNAFRFLLAFVPLFLWTATSAFVSQQPGCRARTHGTNALHQSKSSGKTVYERADPSKLIQLTDYLRDPKPAVQHDDSSKEEPPSLNELLEEALKSFDSDPAKQIVQKLTELRNNQEEATRVLDNLLANGPDRKLPLWARVRFLSRYSRRARLVTLRKTLDLTTPPPNVEEEDESQITNEDQQRRRRRAFVSLLRTLAGPAEEDAQPSASNVPAIVSIYQRARREQNASHSSSSAETMRSRLPEGLETPNYEVMTERSGYEIRRYDPFAVCSVAMNAPRPADAYQTDATVSDPKVGGAQAFGALAGYLFGKNEQNTAMKMTTPVLNRGQTDAKTMSFVLPSEFWKDDGVSLAPQPLPDSGVKLERVEGEMRAVVMFGGYASKKQVTEQTKRLLDKLQRDPEWMPLQGDEPPALAQYNDPFTPPWKRLNEISVPVKSRS